MKRLLPVVAAVLISCGPSVNAGVVVAKHYSEPYSYWVNQCYMYNSNGGCEIQIPTEHYVGPRWRLQLEDRLASPNQKGEYPRDWVGVDEGTYDQARVGQYFDSKTGELKDR